MRSKNPSFSFLRKEAFMQWSVLLEASPFVLPLFSILLLGFWIVMDCYKSTRFHRIFIFFLAVGALWGVLHYQVSGVPDYQEERRWSRYTNAWEVFHYYLGSKYAKELGYTYLYTTALIADEETGFAYRASHIRDLRNNQLVPVSQILAQKELLRSRFTEKRWESFKQDVFFFKIRLVSQKEWDRVLQDKGYNATPPWSFVVHFLSNAVSLQSPGGLTFLTSLDLMLLGLAFVGIGWAFGWPSLFLLLIFMGTHPAMNHSNMKWAYLRLDWLVCLILALCFLRKSWYKTAGVLTAYAGLARIFPLAFAFGVFALLIHSSRKSCEYNLEERAGYRAYLLSFFATLLFFLFLSFLYLGGSIFEDFYQKILLHDQQISLWRIGFKHIFLGTYEKVSVGNLSYIQAFEDRKLYWYLIQGVVILLSFWGLRWMRPEEAQAFSFVLCFFNFAPSYYYYVLLLIPFLFFACRFDKNYAKVGFILAFLGSFFTYFFHDILLYQCSAETWYVLSFSTFILVLYQLGLALFHPDFKSASQRSQKPLH
jgi:hypothetical protein